MSTPPTQSPAAAPDVPDDLPPRAPPAESSVASTSTSVPSSSAPPTGTIPGRLDRKFHFSSAQIMGIVSMSQHLETRIPAESDPYAHLKQESNHQVPESAMPEKCLTFCSQRADGPPICRMFCLRKRKPLETREEQLARLRPPKRQSTVAAIPSEAGTDTIPTDSKWRPATYLYPSSRTFLPPIRPSPISPSILPESSEPSSSSSTSTTSLTRRSWSPFEALRRRVAPYSFVYVRGAPEGPIGRYMEELEFDDGHNDFGMASRGAGEIMQRKRYEPKMEYIDWGEEGSILHVPFTSIFGPIIAIPANLNRVFSPTLRFLTLYRDSFTSGGQARNLDKFQKEITEGSAFQLIGKFQGYWAKRVKEKEEEMERERARAQDVGKGQ